MLTKEIVKTQIEKLPELFSIDDLVEKLILVEKIEKGMRQYENGQILTEEELNKEMEKWFK